MDYEAISVLLKALGHPLRLRIIKCLIEGKCCVNDICVKLNTPQSTVSQHLTVLRNAGAVSPCKHGVRTCYDVSNSRVIDIMELCE